ncbi:MAG: hypothetical protein ACPLXP_01465 [Microgenomates group bacterium]
MIHTKLIVGGNKEERLRKAKQIAEENLGKPLSAFQPDFLLIEGLNSISIDQVRELERKLALKPYSASLKIALIHEAEKLTLPAQNALLKTLEEPPPASLIILTAPQASFLLPTVVSRCQIIRLKDEREIRINKEKIPEILGKRVGERLKIALLYSSSKTQAIEFCQQLLLAWREEMLKKPSAKTARNLRRIQETLLLLQANVNPTLATGNLLLKLVK